ncbi:MAG: TonB-dependent receptor plug domain-containing protein, partial [Sphingomonadaceae bacterium]
VLGGDTLGAALTAAHGRSAGIDIVGGGAGDEDGFSTTTLGLKAAARAGGELGFGLAARYVDHLSEFDGFDPVSFLRADTRDESRTETAAVRLHAGYGAERAGPWTLVAAAQYLWSGNRNFLADDPLNRSEGERRIFSLQGERRFALGGTRHALIAAAEHEEEGFKARDRVFFGATDQDRDRRRAAFVGEWRAEWNSWLSSDIALRRDDFGDFEDATTLRALARAELGEGFSIRGAYGEGIAQPTFFDLHGFFPGSFIGNPALKPESSRGHELGLRWQGARAAVAATLFRHDLEDEIVTVFDPATFLSSAANAAGRSERRGIELAAAAQPASGLEIGANYSWLDAGEPQLGDGLRLREPRRAKHSGNIFFDYRSGGFAAGGALAYVGERRDTDFDIFEDVVLDPYWLASLRLGYRLAENVEAYARVENGFDEDYREVAGYATPGRTFHAGLRFSLGD